MSVAESGSFSDAAAQLGISQSAVSRSVATVEEALGVSLFDRSTRFVRLTEEGREFVERAMLITADLQAAMRHVQPDQPVAPRLTIATLTSVSERHLARSIAATDIRRSRIIEGLHATVEDAVRTGRAIVGLTDLADVGPDLVADPLWDEPFRLAIPRNHRLAKRRHVDLDDIASEPLVAFSRAAELRTTVDRELASARRLRTPDFVVDRYGTALSMVEADLGVMVVPAIIAPHVPRGVKLVDLRETGMRRTMGTIRRPDVDSPPTLRPLLAAVTQSVASIRGVATHAA